MEGDDLDDNQSGDEFLCCVCVSGRYSLASQCAIFIVISSLFQQAFWQMHEQTPWHCPPPTSQRCQGVLGYCVLQLHKVPKYCEALKYQCIPPQLYCWSKCGVDQHHTAPSILTARFATRRHC